MTAAAPANNNARARGNGRAPKPSHAVHKRLGELKTLRDQIRVDLNLAGKEARDRWRGIERRIRATQERVRASESVRALAPLLDSVRKFRATLRRKSKNGG
jgi:hypothetical protein